MLRLALFAIATGAFAQTLSIQIETSSFRIGEAIPLTLRCEGPDGMLSVLSGTGRTVLGLGHDRFAVTPSEGTRDPWEYRLHGVIAYSGPGGTRVGSEPVAIDVDLNQWVRFERPGRYTVQAVFHTVGKGVEIESNAIAIDIVAADPAWQREELGRDVADLRATKAFETRMRAAHHITFLDTAGAVLEMARGLGTADIQTAQIFADGLRSSSHPREAIAAMRELLASPQSPVPGIFLRTLATLDKTLNGPQDALAEVIERKQGAARAISLETLIADMPAASVSAKLRSEIAGAFPDLPRLQQLELLRDRWPSIESAEMVPVLREIYEAAPRSRNPDNELLAAAVERPYGYDSVRTRGLLLDEMKRPDPRLPYKTLAMLPDATLPELDAILLDHLQKKGGRPTEELIARYATGSILEGVNDYYAKRDAEMRSRVTVNSNIAAPACEPPLLAYFLRVDSARGDQLFRQVLGERSYPMGRCWIGIVGQTAVYHAGSAWERVAIDALQDPDVPVKIDAVEALTRYGSPDSKPALLRGVSLLARVVADSR